MAGRGRGRGLTLPAWMTSGEENPSSMESTPEPTPMNMNNITTPVTSAPPATSQEMHQDSMNRSEIPTSSPSSSLQQQQQQQQQPFQQFQPQQYAQNFPPAYPTFPSQTAPMAYPQNPGGYVPQMMQPPGQFMPPGG